MSRQSDLAAAFARIDALTAGIPDKVPDESQGLVGDPSLAEERARCGMTYPVGPGQTHRGAHPLHPDETR